MRPSSAKIFVADVSKQTIIRALQGNVFLLLMVGLAWKDMAMSSCTAQKGGAIVVLTSSNWANSMSTTFSIASIAMRQ